MEPKPHLPCLLQVSVFDVLDRSSGVAHTVTDRFPASSAVFYRRLFLRPSFTYAVTKPLHKTRSGRGPPLGHVTQSVEVGWQPSAVAVVAVSQAVSRHARWWPRVCQLARWVMRTTSPVPGLPQSVRPGAKDITQATLYLHGPRRLPPHDPGAGEPGAAALRPRITVRADRGSRALPDGAAPPTDINKRILDFLAA